ncbi:fimbrial protein [Stenotrophomonas terrae]|uniref:fimbrial protein n=1 Tax=Stenotrophomonas terrae TaxID=405446 RepID=UPI0032086FD1
MTYLIRNLCLLLVLLLPQAAVAMSCKETFSETVHQQINLLNDIVISRGDAVRGRLLWRSEEFSISFRCLDAQSAPDGEYAFFYWDPDNTIAQLHPSIEVGVTIANTDYRINGGAARLLVGAGTMPMANRANCKKHWNLSKAERCATSNVLSVTFSIYIKATGFPPPANGLINNSRSLDLFQVDGDGGLNTSPGSNFRAGIGGLGRIRFIACNPEIRIVANSGSTVDFGRIPSSSIHIGETHKMSFWIEVDMTHPNAGGQCSQKMLMATFDTANGVHEGTIILPRSNGNFGIVLSDPASSERYIQMKKTIPLGTVNHGINRHEFRTALFWMDEKPAWGPFSATATVTVTFR